MASRELELRQQIAEAKAEEKTYEQFDEQQVIDGINDYLKNVPAKLTSIPILSDAQLNGQSTLKVPSVKFQRSAIVSIISTTTSVTTPISVSAANNGTSPDTKLYHDDKKGSMYVYRKDSSPVESTRRDQDYFDIQRKQAELSLSPIHKPTMFSGDVMSYPSFIAAFEVDNPSECLCFLDQYTSGKVKELFQGCLQMKCKDL
ncbi:hypothetical protein pdam_00022210 [Pocillopora damicornis]|uniref:Uncharacterized protein n=1 Tax=Pocillopora damicornis TaxID=46731 RepID=A0A3M6UL99_POCDA|nr:hypothetical protein pdam_00022210 [Pocillopora damicornis]